MTSRFLVLFLALLPMSGCMEGTKPKLYERLGGKEKITRVIDDFFANVGKDDRIKRFQKHFAQGDVAELKQKLIDQIGEATGGPHKYTGKNMRDAHAGLKITNEEFDALVDDLVKALDKNEVGKTEKEELLALLGPMRAQIVSAPSAKAPSDEER
jgi:hemoglobin